MQNVRIQKIPGDRSRRALLAPLVALGELTARVVHGDPGPGSASAIVHWLGGASGPIGTRAYQRVH